MRACPASALTAWHCSAPMLTLFMASGRRRRLQLSRPRVAPRVDRTVPDHGAQLQRREHLPHSVHPVPFAARTVTKRSANSLTVWPSHGARLARRDVGVISALLSAAFMATPVNTELVAVSLATCITLATRFSPYFKRKGYLSIAGGIFYLYATAPVYALGRHDGCARRRCARADQST